MSENEPQAEHSQIISTGIENYENLKDITTLVYLLQAIAFVGFTPIIAVVINYFKKSEVKGLILESHFRWQIRTFWWGLLWFSVAAILNWTIVGAVIGIPIFIAVTIWWFYRVLRGWLALNKNQLMYSS